MATVYCHIYFSSQFLPFIYLFIVLYSSVLFQIPDKSCPQCSLVSVLSYKIAQHAFYLMAWSVFYRNRNHYELEAAAIRGHKHPTAYSYVFQCSDNHHQDKQIIHNTEACSMHTLTPKHTQSICTHRRGWHLSIRRVCTEYAKTGFLRAVRRIHWREQAGFVDTGCSMTHHRCQVFLLQLLSESNETLNVLL